MRYQVLLGARLNVTLPPALLRVLRTRQQCAGVTRAVRPHGPPRGEVIHHARTLGLRARDLRVLYRTADGAMANSGREPFGLVGLESMAAAGATYTGNTGEEYVRHRDLLTRWRRMVSPVAFVSVVDRLNPRDTFLRDDPPREAHTAYEIGDRVAHVTPGYGVVQRVTGDTLSVLFHGAGYKVLDLAIIQEQELMKLL